MCDYSLHGIENRLAQEGEVLVVHRFCSGSKGLTSPEYLKPIEHGKGWRAFFKKLFTPPRDCAVCIPDGAQLMLHGISPSLRHFQGLAATEPVTLRQLSANAQTYRDAVEFKNGLKVRLQELEEGQSVEVLALSSEEVVIRGEVYSGSREDIGDTCRSGPMTRWLVLLGIVLVLLLLLPIAAGAPSDLVAGGATSATACRADGVTG